MSGHQWDTVTTYHAGDGWRWRRQAPNGEIISDSAEAYTREHDANLAAVRANDNCRFQTEDDA